MNEAVRSSKSTYKCEAAVCYGLSSVYLKFDNFDEYWRVAVIFIKPVSDIYLLNIKICN